ncbi:hypothetical protein V6N11_031155 [Hibiscus sabdariffa]|uniref:Uncharacterized protein n=1 Tax=Hibiscus sabdariffa TaxID=183260 RepID=A0ABR2NA29_9ROSI
MRGIEALLAKAWLFWRRAWPTGWMGCFAIVDSMDGVAAVWCASRGMSLPPLVSVVAAALAEGFMLSWPITVAGAVVGHFSWHPSLFSWCASMALSMFCSLFLGFVWPRVIPFSWLASRLAVKTIHAEWSKVRPLWPSHAAGGALGLLVVAKGTPSARPSCLGSARPWWARWLLGSHLWVLASWLINGCWLCLETSLGPPMLVVTSWGRWPLPRAPPRLVTLALFGLGASAPCVRAVFVTLDGCLCGGCSMALPPRPCFAAWLLLHRVSFSARPRRRLISCSTSYLLWATFCNPCFDLCDLTFTAEEQDDVVVAPDSVAIPAEDFACSLVGKVVSPPR